ncbi:MAG: radical SAM protein [Actinobacteria bacterium]|nr:radical SAM protein [Actinomycetota bacterium]
MKEKLKVLLTSFNSCSSPHHLSLALGYLKAYAMADSELASAVDIEIADFCTDCNPVTQVLFYLTGAQPDVVGVSCYCWNMEKVSDLVRLAAGVLPKTTFILGGPEVGPIAEEVLAKNDNAAAVVRGEGEETFTECLKRLAAGDTLAGVAGATYRSGVEIISNPDRPPIEELDRIPSPYLSGALRPLDGVTYLETYRGCPFSCAYCYENKGLRRLRYFSDERVDSEIKYVMSHPEVRTFSFIDSVFNLSKERTAKLVGWLSEANVHGAGLHTIEVATEQVDEETVNLFKKANVLSVETGPQAVHPETTANVSRHFDRDKFSAGVRLMEETGIKVTCDMILGLPRDNFFRFAQTVAFVFGLAPAKVVFSTLNVLPGTALYRQADTAGLEYDEKPPHIIQQTASFPFRELRKAEMFAHSLDREYNMS